ncbi:MAG: hypothetical protein NZL93_04675, partial [Chthoniobacterales bacterium]|nr:hypothetical protein [Chthoniobacterales bacterium]
TPSNYMLRFNANSYVEGRVYRRANAPTLPNVSVPNLPQRGSVNVGGNTITLQGGDYSEIRMTNRNGVLRLGDPNSAEPIEYVFRDSTFNNGRVEILGPVKIYFTSAFSIKSGFSFGNENRPEDLQIFVTSGELDVQSGGLLSARLVAPNSGVTFRGNFRGTLVACYLNIYGNGVAFTLPPIITQ